MNNSEFEKQQFIEMYRDLSSKLTTTKQQQKEVLEVLIDSYILNYMNDKLDSIVIEDIEQLIESL